MTRGRPLGRSGHLLVALGGFVLVAICAFIARRGTVGPAERNVFHAINDLPGWLYPVLWPFQQFGNLLVAVVVGLIVAAVLRKWWVAGAVIAAAMLKIGAERLVKEVVQRSRPGTTIGDITARGDVSQHGLSFVSGHAVIITAVAGLVAPILPSRWKWAPWALVVLNGVVRIYVGAHNPLDVLGGIGVGLVIAGLLNAVIVGRDAPAPASHATPASEPV